MPTKTARRTPTPALLAPASFAHVFAVFAANRLHEMGCRESLKTTLSHGPAGPASVSCHCAAVQTLWQAPQRSTIIIWVCSDSICGVAAVGLFAICLVPVPFVLLIRLLYIQEKSCPDWADASPAFRRPSDRSRRDWKQFDASYRRKFQPASWPLAVVHLARAYLASEECGFALHDALLETGQPELAEIFRTPDHPQRFRVAEAIVQQDTL